MMVVLKTKVKQIYIPVTVSLLRKPLLLLSFLDTYLQAIRYCLFFLEMFTKDTLLQAIRFSIL